jgi:hypothetical protein
VVVVRSRRTLMDEYDDELLQCSQPVLIIRVKLPRSGAYNWAPGKVAAGRLFSLEGGVKDAPIGSTQVLCRHLGRHAPTVLISLQRTNTYAVLRTQPHPLGDVSFHQCTAIHSTFLAPQFGS